MREELLKLLNEHEDLPPLPELVLKIDAELRDQKSPVNKIAKLIETDTVLAGRVLKLANSAFYGGGRREITKLGLALTRLGLNEIRKVVYAVELSKLFSSSDVIDQRQFWRHSLAVALTTQALSRWAKATEEEVENAYLAGLMHDIGLMVFSYLIPDMYKEFLSNLSDKEIPLDKQEIEAFGIDHAEYGHAFIMRWWPIDECVIEAVRLHHFPFDGHESDNRTGQLVHIANIICNTLGFSNGINVYCEMFREGAWDALGLTLTTVDGVLQDVLSSIDMAEQLLES